MRAALAFVLCAGIVASATTSTATTWTVDPSGSGDFADLAVAMSTVSVRDTLMLADGVHDLGVDGYVHDGLNAAVSIVLIGSELGETIIAGGTGGTPSIRLRRTTAEMRFRGIIFRPTVDRPSHGIIVEDGSVAVEDCVFERGFRFGGAGVVRGELEFKNSTIDATETVYGIEIYAEAWCLIENSMIIGGPETWSVVGDWGGRVIDSEFIGGEIGVRTSGTQGGLVLEGCSFSGFVESAIDVELAEISDCLISGCSSPGGEAVIRLGTATTMTRCTVADNQAADGVVWIPPTARDVVVQNTILAFNEGPGLSAYAFRVEPYCCLFWENAEEDYLGIESLDSSNFLEDPLFCDLPGGDYRLDGSSPVAPPAGNCVQVGAFGVGCGFVGADEPMAVLAPTVTPNPLRLGRIATIGVSSGMRKLEILDATGRVVRRLDIPESGDLLWNGTTAKGEMLPAGVYFLHGDGVGSPTVSRLVLLP